MSASHLWCRAKHENWEYSTWNPMAVLAFFLVCSTVILIH